LLSQNPEILRLRGHAKKHFRAKAHQITLPPFLLQMTARAAGGQAFRFRYGCGRLQQILLRVGYADFVK
jgi:hypothetical protein